MRATTIRFSDPIYQRLELASGYTGLPINAIVTTACMEWLRQQFPTSLGVAGAIEVPEVAPVERLLRGPLREALPLLSAEVRGVLARASAEARGFSHNYIGTEHLLIAVAAEDGSVAAQALQRCGIEAERIRETVSFIVGRGNQSGNVEPALTPRAAQAVERAGHEARLREASEIDSSHLLLGLCGDPEGLAARIVESLGSDLERVRAAVEALLA